MLSHMRDFISFNDTFRDQETLTLKITDSKTTKNLGLVPGHYLLFDFYSVDSKVREVFFNFFHAESKEILATVCCTLDARALKAEAILSPMHLQSAVASLLLKILQEDQLTDKSFIRILKARAKQIQSFAHQAEAFMLEPEMEKLMIGFLEKMMKDTKPSQDISPKSKSNLLAFPTMPTDIDPLKMLEILVHLQYTDVERLIQVPAHLSLEDLHHILQVSMGWENYHMWQFVDRSGQLFYISDDDEPMFSDYETQYASKTSIGQLLKRKGSKTIYEYDFGDNWEHLLTVKRTYQAPSKKEALVKCLSGQLAAPPEDCGGVPGYTDILEAFKKRSKMSKDLKEWLGDYNPNTFDLKQVNQKLKKLCK